MDLADMTVREIVTYCLQVGLSIPETLVDAVSVVQPA